MCVCWGGGGEGGGEGEQRGRKKRKQKEEKKTQALEEKQHYPDSLKKQANGTELN